MAKSVPDRPTIGQYTDSYLPVVDGVVMTVHNYALWLNKGNFTCYVASAMAPHDYKETELYPIIRYRSVPITQRPPYRYGFPLLDSRFINATTDMKPDLVHAHSPFNAGLEARRMARRYKIPLVASFHSKYYDDVLQATRSKFLAEIAVEHIVRFYSSVDFVWTVNQSTAKTLRDYGYQKTIEIMPNGTDLVQPADIKGARAMVDTRFGLSADDRILLFVGQHILQKNLMLLLDAIALLAKTCAHFKLLMVGDGYARKALEERAQELRITDRIIFAGVLRDRTFLTAIYLRAALFTFPSVYDNAPLVVREAASAGCPSVMIRGSNAAEGAMDCINAFLCEESAESLSQAIRHALNDEPLRASVGRKAGETMGRSWQDIITDVGARYREIILEYEPKPKMLLRQLDRKNREILRTVILKELKQAKDGQAQSLRALLQPLMPKKDRHVLLRPAIHGRPLKLFRTLPDKKKKDRTHDHTAR